MVSRNSGNESVIIIWALKKKIKIAKNILKKKRVPNVLMPSNTNVIFYTKLKVLVNLCGSVG